MSLDGKAATENVMQGKVSTNNVLQGKVATESVLKGTASADGVMHGRINSVSVLTIDAYGVAVRNGFVGTEQEWLNSLKASAASCLITHIELLASKWQGTESPYSQVVSIGGVTGNSRVDINPSVEQLAIFHDKDIAFVTENEDGVVTVYCIGQKPANDYTMQVTVTEVIANG